MDNRCNVSGDSGQPDQDSRILMIMWCLLRGMMHEHRNIQTIKLDCTTIRASGDKLARQGRCTIMQNESGSRCWSNDQIPGG
jgi:hypothetical protein